MSCGMLSLDNGRRSIRMVTMHLVKKYRFIILKVLQEKYLMLKLSLDGVITDRGNMSGVNNECFWEKPD